MEYLSAKLANYILKKGLIDTEAYEIYQYGFQRPFQVLCKR